MWRPDQKHSAFHKCEVDQSMYLIFPSCKVLARSAHIQRTSVKKAAFYAHSSSLNHFRSLHRRQRHDVPAACHTAARSGPPSLMYESGYSSMCVCTVTSMWLSAMGPAEIGLALACLRDAGLVWELYLILTTVSMEQRRVTQNVLHIRRDIYCEGAIHPC